MGDCLDHMCPLEHKSCLNRASISVQYVLASPKHHLASHQTIAARSARELPSLLRAGAQRPGHRRPDPLPLGRIRPRAARSASGVTRRRVGDADRRVGGAGMLAFRFVAALRRKADREHVGERRHDIPRFDVLDQLLELWCPQWVVFCCPPSSRPGSGAPSRKVDRGIASD